MRALQQSMSASPSSVSAATESQPPKASSGSGGPSTHRERVARWRAVVEAYTRPHGLRASWQLINTIGGYVGLWVAMYFVVQYSWWLTIPLAIVAGGFLVRAFIIFHDCCHGSFFRSPKLNSFWGTMTGLLAFTPFYHWRWEHVIHHATSGHLDKRGTGDIWTLTVDEYLRSSRWRKFAYRLARHPVPLFLIAPVFVFVIYQRFSAPTAKPRERHSVWIMNIALLALHTGLVLLFGFWSWFFIQLTIMVVSGAGGLWLFYVQHQFEDTYWERGDNWDYTDAALQGSSYYKLPKVLQWFSGNIGFHHIHHLSPRVPNYYLESCHRSDSMFDEVKALTVWKSLKSLKYRLWDEQERRLVGFGYLRQLRRATQSAAARSNDGQSQGSA